MGATGNIDRETVEGFGHEWAAFDQSALAESELRAIFDGYFDIFPWDALPPDAVGFDLGCGSGRWAKLVAPRVGKLYCIDASAEALDVARRNLRDRPNCAFLRASVDDVPLAAGSMDFGYCLGVLHHVPDTAAGIRACVEKLKPGAPFLLYLYYAFDNRPVWFRALWKGSDLARRLVSRLPRGPRIGLCSAIAAVVYFPLARLSRGLEHIGVDVRSVPLSVYRDRSFYSMRTDALDRFGTRLEQRFTAAEIARMMRAAGLGRIEFSKQVFWCAVGYREHGSPVADAGER